MFGEQKSTQVQQQARQRQMTKVGETWQVSAEENATQQAKPAAKTRCVFASVNGYAQAEVITTSKRT